MQLGRFYSIHWRLAWMVVGIGLGRVSASWLADDSDLRWVRAANDVVRLGIAVSDYSSKYGSPVIDEGDGLTWFQRLQRAGSTYQEPSDVFIPLDPYGNPYELYVANGASSIYVVSRGPDGICDLGQEDDIICRTTAESLVINYEIRDTVNAGHHWKRRHSVLPKVITTACVMLSVSLMSSCVARGIAQQIGLTLSMLSLGLSMSIIAWIYDAGLWNVRLSTMPFGMLLFIISCGVICVAVSYAISSLHALMSASSKGRSHYRSL